MESDSDGSKKSQITIHTNPPASCSVPGPKVNSRISFYIRELMVNHKKMVHPPSA